MSLIDRSKAQKARVEAYHASVLDALNAATSVVVDPSSGASTSVLDIDELGAQLAGTPAQLLSEAYAEVTDGERASLLAHAAKSRWF